jgi:hypothetical protein
MEKFFGIALTLVVALIGAAGGRGVMHVSGAKKLDSRNGPIGIAVLPCAAGGSATGLSAPDACGPSAAGDHESMAEIKDAGLSLVARWSA